LKILSVVVADVVMLLKNLTTPPLKVPPRLPHRRAVPLFKVKGNNEGELFAITKLEMYLTKLLSFSIKLKIARLRLLLKKEALYIYIYIY
jgi:hypothetical protein